MTLKIAIVGRPNVGKSTLFNRLVGRKVAIVHDKPGVTRDRREASAKLQNLKLQVIDTAGYEYSNEDNLEKRMWEQTQKAICSVLILQRMKKLETESHFGLANPCIKSNGYTEQEITKSLELGKEFYLWENTFLTTMTEILLIQSQTIWQLTLTAIC